VLVVAVVVLAIIYFPRVDYGRRYYVEISKLWREAEAKRQLAGDDEWDRFVQRSQNKLEPLLEHMLRRSNAGKGTPAELHLIYVIRDYWKGALDRRNPQTEYYQQLVQTNLRIAEAMIENRPVPGAWPVGKAKAKRKTTEKPAS